MSCEHPACSRAKRAICTTHCNWSLCQEHIDEHRQILFAEFERTLKNILQPKHELSKFLDNEKKNLDEYQKKEVRRIEQYYRKEIGQIEQKFLGLSQFQDEYETKSAYVTHIKNNPDCLTQDDFQQLDLLRQQLQYNQTNDKRLFENSFLQ
jgi:hypothetical protein